jgi:hypothetical protein
MNTEKSSFHENDVGCLGALNSSKSTKELLVIELYIRERTEQ